MAKPQSSLRISLPNKDEGDSREVDQNTKHLPQEVLHDILSRVPFGDAARTMVLSKRWLRAFCSMPELDIFHFSRNLYKRLDNSEEAACLGQLTSSTRIEAFINGETDQFVMSILNQRGEDAVLKKFCFYGCLSSEGFTACIRKLVSLDVPFLDFAFVLYSDLALPGRFYTHRSMEHLNLQSIVASRRPHLVDEERPYLCLTVKRVIQQTTFKSLKHLLLTGVCLFGSVDLRNFFVSENFPILNFLSISDCCAGEEVISGDEEGIYSDEDISFDNEDHPLKIDIKTLLKLKLYCSRFGFIKVYGENLNFLDLGWCTRHGRPPWKITVNTPRLERFSWSGHGTEISFLAPEPPMRSTFLAEINLSCEPSFLTPAIMLLESLVEVTRFCIRPETIEVLGLMKVLRSPSFQVIKCKEASYADVTIVPTEMGVVGLGSFLAMCPNLSSLTLGVEPYHSPLSNFIFSQVNLLEENPNKETFWRDRMVSELGHLLSNIRELNVTLRGFLAIDIIISFVRMILENATHLETAKITRSWDPETVVVINPAADQGEDLSRYYAMWQQRISQLESIAPASTRVMVQLL